MAANVAEGAQSSLLIADDKNWFTGDFGGEISFRVGDGLWHAVRVPAGLHRGANKLPGAAKDFFLLDFEDSRIGVKARGERVGALDLFIDIQAKRHVEVRRFGVHGQVL